MDKPHGNIILYKIMNKKNNMKKRVIKFYKFYINVYYI